MLIIGAGGYAKELLELVEAEYGYNSIAFFDNISNNQLRFLFDSYEIIKSLNAAQSFFKASNSFEFVLGVGGPSNREKLHHLITSIGGKKYKQEETTWKTVTVEEMDVGLNNLVQKHKK